MSKFNKIGELNKTSRQDMLKGKLFIKELNLEVEIFGFIKTNLQKKFKNDPDVVLFTLEQEEDNIF